MAASKLKNRRRFITRDSQQDIPEDRELTISTVDSSSRRQGSQSNSALTSTVDDRTWPRRSWRVSNNFVPVSDNSDCLEKSTLSLPRFGHGARDCRSTQEPSGHSSGLVTIQLSPPCNSDHRKSISPDSRWCQQLSPSDVASASNCFSIGSSPTETSSEPCFMSTCHDDAVSDAGFASSRSSNMELHDDNSSSSVTSGSVPRKISTSAFLPLPDLKRRSYSLNEKSAFRPGRPLASFPPPGSVLHRALTWEMSANTQPSGLDRSLSRTPSSTSLDNIARTSKSLAVPVDVNKSKDFQISESEIFRSDFIGAFDPLDPSNSLRIEEEPEGKTLPTTERRLLLDAKPDRSKRLSPALPGLNGGTGEWNWETIHSAQKNLNTSRSYNDLGQPNLGRSFNGSERGLRQEPLNKSRTIGDSFFFKPVPASDGVVQNGFSELENGFEDDTKLLFPSADKYFPGKVSQIITKINEKSEPKMEFSEHIRRKPIRSKSLKLLHFRVPGEMSASGETVSAFKRPLRKTDPVSGDTEAGGKTIGKHLLSKPSFSLVTLKESSSKENGEDTVHWIPQTKFLEYLDLMEKVSRRENNLDSGQFSSFGPGNGESGKSSAISFPSVSEMGLARKDDRVLFSSEVPDFFTAFDSVDPKSIKESGKTGESCEDRVSPGTGSKQDDPPRGISVLRNTKIKEQLEVDKNWFTSYKDVCFENDVHQNLDSKPDRKRLSPALPGLNGGIGEWNWETVHSAQKNLSTSRSYNDLGQPNLERSFNGSQLGLRQEPSKKLKDLRDVENFVDKSDCDLKASDMCQLERCHAKLEDSKMDGKDEGDGGKTGTRGGHFPRLIRVFLKSSSQLKEEACSPQSQSSVKKLSEEEPRKEGETRKGKEKEERGITKTLSKVTTSLVTGHGVSGCPLIDGEHDRTEEDPELSRKGCDGNDLLNGKEEIKSNGVKNFPGDFQTSGDKKVTKELQEFRQGHKEEPKTKTVTSGCFLKVGQKNLVGKKPFEIVKKKLIKPEPISWFKAKEGRSKISPPPPPPPPHNITNLNAVREVNGDVEKKVRSDERTGAESKALSGKHAFQMSNKTDLIRNQILNDDVKNCEPQKSPSRHEISQIPDKFVQFPTNTTTTTRLDTFPAKLECSVVTELDEAIERLTSKTRMMDNAAPPPPPEPLLEKSMNNLVSMSPPENLSSNKVPRTANNTFRLPGSCIENIFHSSQPLSKLTNKTSSLHWPAAAASTTTAKEHRGWRNSSGSIEGVRGSLHVAKVNPIILEMESLGQVVEKRGQRKTALVRKEMEDAFNRPDSPLFPQVFPLPKDSVIMRHRMHQKDLRCCYSPTNATSSSSQSSEDDDLPAVRMAPRRHRKSKCLSGGQGLNKAKVVGGRSRGRGEERDSIISSTTSTRRLSLDSSFLSSDNNNNSHPY